MLGGVTGGETSDFLEKSDVLVKRMSWSGRPPGECEGSLERSLVGSAAKLRHGSAGMLRSPQQGFSMADYVQRFGKGCVSFQL